MNELEKSFSITEIVSRIDCTHHDRTRALHALAILVREFGATRVLEFIGDIATYEELSAAITQMKEAWTIWQDNKINDGVLWVIDATPDVILAEMGKLPPWYTGVKK